jgi:hypothetical protein
MQDTLWSGLRLAWQSLQSEKITIQCSQKIPTFKKFYAILQKPNKQNTKTQLRSREGKTESAIQST